MKDFKSGKQRRAEIKAARVRARQRLLLPEAPPPWPKGPVVAVNVHKLMRSNSYGLSDFVERGYYLDRPFRCIDCGAEEIWSAEDQRWWYEEVGGSQYARAVRCAPCRAREKLRKETARQASLAGMMKKLAGLAGGHSA